MPRALLYINPKARRGESVLESAESALREHGVEPVRITCERPSELGAAFLAQREGADRVIVGGGDGTIISAIGPVRDVDLPLAILPLGTMNDLARTLGIPLDIGEACALAASDARRPIDVGMVNDAYFVNEASIGISTRIASEQTVERKRRLGLFAVPYTTLIALRYSRPFHVTIAETHETLRTIQLTVANSHHFGAFFTNQQAAIDDGFLDLYAVDTKAWQNVFPLLRAFIDGRFRDVPGIVTRRNAEFTVTTRRPRRVFADGEFATMTPARFRVLPSAITVVAPPEPPDRPATQ